MVRIGLISDTHGSMYDGIWSFFSECDEIWHAGDIGSIEFLEKLNAFKKVRAVYGNIDDYNMRMRAKEVNSFRIESHKVVILHISGYPDRYSPEAKRLITKEKPTILVGGHSHILKVIYDKKNNLLHLNPGAAGHSGFHTKITALRFVIDGREIRDMEILEHERRD